VGEGKLVNVVVKIEINCFLCEGDGRAGIAQRLKIKIEKFFALKIHPSGGLRLGPVH
jgi:hypothetical protein